ncbi:MAG: hypothetical protein MI864_20305 [Pseudomonadales bacterium]|nr:hypothetical protein [Pseudomonadales bacterium]
MLKFIQEFRSTDRFVNECVPKQMSEWYRGALENISSGLSAPEISFRLGAQAPCLGWAFFGGYQVALSALLQSLGGANASKCSSQYLVSEDFVNSLRTLRALSYSEPGLKKPEQLKAELVDGRVSGHKSFVTGGDQAQQIILLAKMINGTDIAPDQVEREGRSDIVAVTLRPELQSGMLFTAMNPLPFAPELLHSELRLDNVELTRSSQVHNDAVNRILKPFRWLEDVNVFASVLGYLSAASVAVDEKYLCAYLFHAFRGLESAYLRVDMFAQPETSVQSSAGPDANEGVLILAGLQFSLNKMTPEIDGMWAKVGDVALNRWRRDVPLMGIAQSVRDRRFAKVW